MASWRDELQGGGVASFRGVPFELSSARTSYGRRNVKHEYPQRDRPFVEDLGRKARPFSMVAFVVGDDYFAKRDACIAAAEQGGPGTLLHPYLGTITVNCDELTVEEETGQGRMARLTWTFTESGNLTFPTTDQQTAEAARLQSTATSAAAGAEFQGTFTVAGQPGFVIDDAEDNLQTLVDELRGAVEPLFDVVDDFAGFTLAVSNFEADIAALVTTPDQIAVRLRAIYATIVNLDALRFLHDDAGTEGPLDATTAAGLVEQTNAEAVLRLQVQTALSSAVAVVTVSDFVALDDAEAVRDELANRINSESEIVATDDLFTALIDLRTDLVEFVDAEFQDLPSLRTFTVPVLTASIVLAWDLYADAERDEEINTRNAVQHPLYLSPHQSLSVLSS